MVEEIRTIDLFSGIGGFRGLEKANGKHTELRLGGEEGEYREQPEGGGAEQGSSGDSGVFRCVWSCDWDYDGDGKKAGYWANRIYAHHFGWENHSTADIKGVDAGDIPDHDLLCAGFPCQPFSVAGPGKGFQDTRGTVFFEICRIARAKRPRLLLLENVKGLLSNDRGQTFLTILEELGSIGYWCEWQVLNSKHFGVPQHRERVFLVGHLGEKGGQPIFPITEADGVADEVAGGSEEQVALSIDRNYWKGPDKHGQRTMIVGNLYPSEGEAGKVVSPDGIYPTVKQGKRGGKAGMPAVLAVETAYTRANMKEGRFSEVCHALDGGNSKAVMGIDYANAIDSSGYLRSGGHHPEDHRGAFAECRIRRLTPLECERLMGFPDNWTKNGIDENGKAIPISDTARYKCLGNAVVTNVVQFLGRRILDRTAASG